MSIIKKSILKEYKLNPDEDCFVDGLVAHFIEKNDFFGVSTDEGKYKKYITINNHNDFENTQSIERIEDAAGLFISFLKEKKRIIIITDADLDGTSSKAIAFSVDLFLKRKFGYKNIFEHYFAWGDGHGISFEQVDSLISETEEVLLVTADNGINNKKQIEKIRSKYKNVKIIITDHHSPDVMENVFGLVDYVINPEVIEMGKCSRVKSFTSVGGDLKSNFSGGHVFYMFMLEIIDQLKINSDVLREEMKVIALFSDIGDIINYDLDVAQAIAKNIFGMERLAIIRGIRANLDIYNKFEENEVDKKIQDYISEGSTILNSARRLNSILLNFNNKNEKDFKDWMFEKFEINLDEEEIDKESLWDVFVRLNSESKKIYDYFTDGDKNGYSNGNKYSYIKEMAMLLLLQENEQKSETDKVMLGLAFNILSKLNKVKNKLRDHIVKNDLYETVKYKYLEIFLSKKDGILREILSIQAFIEADAKKSLITLAKNGLKINGSIRSKKVDLKDLFENNQQVLDIKSKYGIRVDIFGHAKAAGIFFEKEDKSDLLVAEFKSFIAEVNVVIDNLGLGEIEDSSLSLSISKLSNYDVLKLYKITKKFLYPFPHPFFEYPKFKVVVKDIEELVGKIVLKKSKSSEVKYMSVKDGNSNTFLYFEDKKNPVELTQELEMVSDLQVKYNGFERAFYYEMILSPKK